MNIKRTLFWATFFSVAMGFLETAVVIYLRKIYYPNGFSFPLAPVHHEIAITELWRELATLIMLYGIGQLAGKNKAERFAYFIYSFAIWDIFYYVFLKLFIGWPESLMTWDILFLLPVPWVGPVIAPVIIALTLILFAMAIIYYSENGIAFSTVRREKLLLWLGSLVAIASFTEDFVKHKGDILMSNMRSGGALLTDLADYVPTYFDWMLFSVGEGIILLSFILYVKRLRKSTPKSRN
jgi:hypothetical protein